MIKLGMVGLGKMGISHYVILNAHSGIEVAAIADTNAFVLSTIKKHTGRETFKDYKKMIDKASLDAVVVATPSLS